MPKLSAQQKAATDTAESSGYLMPSGRYLGTLSKVEERPPGQYSKTGEPTWSWEFTDILDEDGNKRAGRQWVTVGTGTTSAWKMKEMFDAFGYDTDSDTDEMIGEKAILVIDQEVSQFGSRKGETVNFVKRVAPYDPEIDTGFESGGTGEVAAGGNDSF